MAFVVMSRPPSREMYEKVAKAAMQGGPAAGLIVHTASEVDGGVRVVDVWESKEDAERFERDVLMPAIEAALGGPPPPSMAEKFETFDVVRGA